MTHMRTLTLLLVLTILGISSCSVNKNITSYSGKKPKKIIFLIGDGMGLTQISTLFLGKDNTNNFKRFKSIGFINTRSGSHKITDSAAGATAFSCGEKTYNNAVGMNMDSASITNIVEVFSGRKYLTGVVSTSSITHATPASFYAHAKHRKLQYDIAQQLLKSDIDFFAGGGSEYFHKLGADIGLYSWEIDSSNSPSWTNLSFDPNKRYGFLSAPDGLPNMLTGRGDYLKSASLAAIDYFDNKPYFLMVEGSQIDWGGHATDYEYVYSEMQDFDQTLGAILDYAEKDGNTLVVVTADHETGGLSLRSQSYIDNNGNSRSDYDKVEAGFNTGGHTAALIPVFAYGPGAQSFQGVYENNEIYNKLMALMR